ncbi:MAG: hypothetical protein HY291_01935 [Planctomycetes bacterium]|nr:hypothetical protein [Planctomycetota bacterium]
MRELLGLSLAVLVLAGSANLQAADAAAGSHERAVNAAIVALCLEAYIHPCDVMRTEVTKDGRTATILRAPYSDWMNLAAKAEVEIRGGEGGSKLEIKTKVTTGNLVWTRHKDFDERLRARIDHCLACVKLNDTQPTPLPPAPIPKPKVIEPPPPRTTK